MFPNQIHQIGNNGVSEIGREHLLCALTNNATVIDEKVLNECLNEITRALLQSDVQFKLVRDMQTNIKKIVNLEVLAAGHDKRKIIQKAIHDELCKMLDPGKPSFTPKKGKPSVVMFVGLQGMYVMLFVFVALYNIYH